MLDLTIHGNEGGWDMGHGMMGWGGGMGWFGGIMMFLFWAAFMVGLIILIRWLWLSSSRYAGGGVSDGNAALNILKERFAKGEIDKEEFEAKLKTLKGGP